MSKLTDIVAAGGILPAALSGVFGKENRGFGLGVLPGALYKDYYEDKEEEKQRKGAEAMTSSPAPAMKKGGKVKSASARADGIAKRGKTKGKIV